MRAFILFCLLMINMPLALAWSGVVYKVFDGNTIRVKHESGKFYDVKLYGVQAPALSQPHGIEARDAARKLLEDKSVDVTPITLDSARRMVAIVAINDQYTTQAFLVGRGLAWVHTGQCEVKTCAHWVAMQDQAVRSRQGLWADAHPVAPWKWRESNTTTKRTTQKTKKRVRRVVRKKKTVAKPVVTSTKAATSVEQKAVMPTAPVVTPSSEAKAQ